jgi:hypothetical protein
MAETECQRFFALSKRVPKDVKRYCGICRQHGVMLETRGHICTFKDCNCNKVSGGNYKPGFFGEKVTFSWVFFRNFIFLAKKQRGLEAKGDYSIWEDDLCSSVACVTLSSQIVQGARKIKRVGRMGGGVLGLNLIFWKK